MESGDLKVKERGRGKRRKLLQKERLIERYRREGILRSRAVIEAFRKVPREEFVPPRYREQAYLDTPLPIGYGQTISAPHMVCIYAEQLDLKVGLKVLEIGAGSGYNAAVMAEIVAPENLPQEKWGHVYTVEIVPELCTFAQANLERAGYGDRVTVLCRDGSTGLPEYSPYDRIAVTASAPDVPEPLVEQLKEGGLLLIPVGSSFFQKLLLISKREGKIVKRDLGAVAFVPLRGRFGWKS